LYFWGVEERVYKIALSLLQGIGVIKTKTLVSYIGGAEAVFKASDKELAALSITSLKRIKELKRKEALERAREEVEFIDKNGIELHYYQDANYPVSLRFCEDGPLVLYSKGNVQFNKENIAVVGTRKASSYGKMIVQELMKDLAPRGVQIISGLAHGIDKEAHEAALANGLSTIAVLGHGLDLIYPAAHKNLANRMLETGGIVTEFHSKYPGDPSNFPKRNRIVAGLSSATVVIESAISGGSLITANLANDYSREVFAFPGNIDRLQSDGCNFLIRKNIAHLITCAEDMAEVMGWEKPTVTEPEQTDLFELPSVEEEKIIAVLKQMNQLIHFDELNEKTQMDIGELSLNLFNLEMRGKVESLPGNNYRIA
jgi:DNA processing protein